MASNKTDVPSTGSAQSQVTDLPADKTETREESIGRGVKSDAVPAKKISGNPGRISRDGVNYDKSNSWKSFRSRKYLKENTVILSTRDRVDIDDIIDEIELMSGVGSVLACVPDGEFEYLVTMTDEDSAKIVADGLKVDTVELSGSMLVQDLTMVSILHLPAYIEDRVIIDKIESYGLQVKSPVYRKIYRRNKKVQKDEKIDNSKEKIDNLKEKEKSKVEDGTRYMRVKFPPNFTSLPYALKFSTHVGVKYYRTKHDNQKEVCNKCLEQGHKIRECPQNTCFICKYKGHIARDCPTQEQKNDSDYGNDSENEREKFMGKKIKQLRERFIPDKNQETTPSKILSKEIKTNESVKGQTQNLKKEIGVKRKHDDNSNTRVASRENDANGQYSDVGSDYERENNYEMESDDEIDKSIEKEEINDLPKQNIDTKINCSKTDIDKLFKEELIKTDSIQETDNDQEKDNEIISKSLNNTDNLDTKDESTDKSKIETRHSIKETTQKGHMHEWKIKRRKEKKKVVVNVEYAEKRHAELMSRREKEETKGGNNTNG